MVIREGDLRTLGANHDKFQPRIRAGNVTMLWCNEQIGTRDIDSSRALSRFRDHALVGGAACGAQRYDALSRRLGEALSGLLVSRLCLCAAARPLTA